MPLIRIELIEAKNQIEFWSRLPGGADHLAQYQLDGHEEVIASAMVAWMFQSPAVLEIKEIRFIRPTFTRLPSEIRLCAQLGHLNLSGSSIEELPEEIGALSRLASLSIMSGSLRRLCPELAQLQRLEYLCLDFNQIESIEPVSQLTRLIDFSAMGNRIWQIPSRLYWPKIESIDLAQNQITKIPDSFYDLTTLTALQISCNDLLQLSEKIGQLTRLMELDVRSTGLTSLPASLDGLMHLEHLAICDNPINEISRRVRDVLHLK